jgi:hypothetical protein
MLHEPIDTARAISLIRERHRQRQDIHRAEKSLTLQIKAICRRACAGLLSDALRSGDMDRAAFLKRTKADADVLYAALIDGEAHPLFLAVHPHIESFFQARAMFQTQRRAIEKHLESLAVALPIAPFVTAFRGLGMASLAAIVGEAGDLSTYSTHSKLWRRLGLAPFDGKAPSTWRKKGGLSAEQWTEVGYSPIRRSIVWNAGQCVLKAQSARVSKEGVVLREAGLYRLVYDARKQYELDRGIPKGHAHNRAIRYMDKKIIRDLWRAWRALSATDIAGDEIVEPQEKAA